MKVLFVDDDENILKTFKRSLSGDYEVHVASGPEKGLETVAMHGPFAVVVSDFKMPGMDGITFLNKVRKLSADTVRVMLTGYADLDNTMAAVNSGEVFRFLTKPCEVDTLSDVLTTCIKQYGLVIAEKELLEKTLKGCIQMLSELLSIVNPEAFGRANRLSRFVRMIAKKMKRPAIWKYEVAAMLSQVGCVVLPESAIIKLNKGKQLSPEEAQLFDMHPVIGKSLLAHIPRMGGIAEMVHYQSKGYDGSGTPLDSVKGEDIPFGARLIRLASDFELAHSRLQTWSKAFLEVEKSSELYDPEMLYYLEGCLGSEARYDKKRVHVKDFRPGMIIQEPILAVNGTLLIGKSKELSKIIITKLLAVHERIGVKEPVEMLIPAELPDSDGDGPLADG